jgi:predicted transcriptional regulator of viral defense system
VAQIAKFCDYWSSDLELLNLIALSCRLWHNNCMRFEYLLSLLGDLPFFETGLLLAGNVDPNDVRRQLSRWTHAGKIRQLRRGLYTLAPPHNKVTPHPFLIANALVHGSYVSGTSILAYYGLIPEYVPGTFSVTLSRPSQWDGGFVFQHLAPRLLFGYQSIEVVKGQFAFIAQPEKAILDLAHLTQGSDNKAYLTQLRLQNLERLDLKRLQEFAERADKPKWKRVAIQVASLALQEESEYKELP